MTRAILPFGDPRIEIELPESAEILGMAAPKPLADPGRAIRAALRRPIGLPGLDEIVRRKLATTASPRVALVVSDNTRPVPYRGEAGLLVPIVELLRAEGIAPERITIIVATGTHRALTQTELEAMLDPAVLALPLRVVCHDCRDRAGLVHLGRTSRGTEVFINRLYMEADLKILTGLVESHFMAGASGGRKSVCPGLIGEESTYIFHGAAFLSSPNARDLVLTGNPCHEEATEVARMAGVDFLVNVTVSPDLTPTGVFAGDLESAHREAVERLAEYVSIPVEKEYDVVLTHAGFVGINHYQAAKAAVEAIPVLKPGGRLILVADDADRDPVGSLTYRTLLHLLKLNGPEAFRRLIRSPDWQFVPDQWEVQMWARVFDRIPMDNLTYCAPRYTAADAALLPGRDGNLLLPQERRYTKSEGVLAEMATRALTEALAACAAPGIKPAVAFLRDGPYGIPVRGAGKVGSDGA